MIANYYYLISNQKIVSILDEIRFSSARTYAIKSILGFEYKLKTVNVSRKRFYSNLVEV